MCNKRVVLTSVQCVHEVTYCLTARQSMSELLEWGREAVKLTPHIPLPLWGLRFPTSLFGHSNTARYLCRPVSGTTRVAVRQRHRDKGVVLNQPFLPHPTKQPARAPTSDDSTELLTPENTRCGPQNRRR